MSSASESIQGSPRRIVLREAVPEHGRDGVVALIYPDKVYISQGQRGIALTPEEAVKLSAEIVRDYPLDALSEV